MAIDPETQRPTPLHSNHPHSKQDGAQMAGVHTSFGVPVVQGNTVYVLVFYSGRRGDARYHEQAISAETLDYIRRSTAAWRIKTTFSPSSTSLSTFVSAARRN